MGGGSDENTQPFVHGIEQRLGLFLPNGAAYVWWLAAYPVLDHIQFRNPAQCFGRDRRGMGDVEVMELASRVSHACSLNDFAGLVQRRVAGERIGDVLQVSLRMGALPIS